jgi:CHASE2 domain-containing sensor protein/signal transduction histidine kinase
MLNQRRLALEWFVLLIGGVALAWFVARGEVTRRLDYSMLDFATSLARREPAQDIAIVAIDERSLAMVGEWPWRRSTHAKLIDNLRAAGAKIVLYDVLFVEPGDPQDDAALAQAIARHGKVVLAHNFTAKLNQADGIEPVYPLPALADAAAAMGHVETVPDTDGVLRRFALELQVDGQVFPHFVKAALGLQGGQSAPQPLTPAEPSPVVPFNAANSYPVIPAFAVIDGTIPRELIAGRTVLVGATAQGMGDTHSVPARDIGLMSGVETQANLLDGLRSGTLIREAPEFWTVALAAAALLAQFLGFWKLSARAGFLLSASLMAIVAAASIMLVPLAGLWVAPGAALLLVALAYPMWSWRRLTVVSDYLSHEARHLMIATGETARVRGFDIVAQQVNQMRQLVGEVSGALQFVRSAIEASPDAIIVADKDNRVLLFNQAARHLFSETPDPVGQSLADLYLNQKLAIDHDAAEVTLGDGRVFLYASAPLAGQHRGGDGNHITAFRDITQMRHRQRENDELIEFLSHDMRSPQVAIMALTLSLDETNADIARRIRSQAELTLGLADGFVQLARLRETGARFERHDLSFILHEAMDQAHALASRKGIAVQRHIPEEPVFADMDRGQITRLAANLIGNAIKHIQEGGTVIVQLAVTGTNEAQITVTDNGPGLPEERREDPFARFGPRGTSDQPSAGLGLAFVKRVVDAHHGAIDTWPGPGGGTVFAVRLPLVQPRADGGDTPQVNGSLPQPAPWPAHQHRPS